MNLVQTRLSCPLVSHAAKIIAFTMARLWLPRSRCARRGGGKVWSSHLLGQLFNEQQLQSCLLNMTPVAPTQVKWGECLSHQCCPLGWASAASWGVLVSSSCSKHQDTLRKSECSWDFLALFLYSQEEKSCFSVHMKRLSLSKMFT